MSDPGVLAIDQGTTGTRAIVMDQQGTVRAWAYREFTQHFPQPGWVEHDANEIWDVTDTVVREAIAKAPDVTVCGIGITNQRETTVLWDRATGEPLGRAIVWQDRRTAARCDEIRADGHAESIRARTGLPVDPYFSGTKLEWMLDHQPDARTHADAGGLAFGTIDSWLIWKLTGGRVHASDVTNASRTMLFNIREMAWDDEMLELLRIPRAVLPSVVSSSTIIGETSEGAPTGPGVPIAGVAGDQQAAMFGQACHAPGAVKNTYGTGCFALLNTGREVPDVPDLIGTVAWQLADEPPEYALEGSVFAAGAAVQWLRDGLGIIESAPETEALATSIPSNEGVYFVPALSGLGAPHWDAYARGMLIGLTRGTGRAHIARAALEAIAFQSADVIDAMCSASKTALGVVRADGGAVDNGFLMQFQADLLGAEVQVPALRETTAGGAAYLAGLAIGLWPDRDAIAETWRLDRTFRPQMPDPERASLRARWLEAVDRSRGWERPSR